MLWHDIRRRKISLYFIPSLACVKNYKENENVTTAILVSLGEIGRRGGDRMQQEAFSH